MDKTRPVYVVRKCTTDQLNSQLNDINYDYFTGGEGEVMQVTHVGGRDWVVIFRCKGSDDEGYELIGQKVEGSDTKRRILR